MQPAQDHLARIVFDCRTANDLANTSSTIPAHAYELRVLTEEQRAELKAINRQWLLTAPIEQPALPE